MFTNHIADRVAQIRRRTALAAGGRAVTLVAAAKTQPAELVREAVRAGVDAVGENRVQELLEKDAQGAYEGAPLHFIGHLQKNKISKITGRVSLIHSVDSAALAEAIDVCAGKLGICQDILIQVNIALEETKGGFPPGELTDALKAMSSLKNISIRGLMCIPPPVLSSGDTHYFEQMRQIYDSIRESGLLKLDILSMGMSDDFEQAVRAGATMVRIGSVIFGPR
jgi:hypothetical protein